MKCRACASENLTSVLNLGEQYTSDFRTDDSKPPKHSLEAVICLDCWLVQLTINTPQAEMYHDNYGFKSGISDSIKSDLMSNVVDVTGYIDKPKRWLDIASNDGTLLSFVPRSVERVGIDPIGFLCEQAKSHADKIINDFFNIRHFADYDGPHGEVHYEKFDVVTSISCFYDMPDPDKFVGDVSKLLARRGVWDIQQNYLLATMEQGAVDNFCAEHLTYFTLLSLEPILERHGLEVFDVKTPVVNGGSLRTLVARKGNYPVQNSVETQRTIEKDAKLNELQTYKDFATKAVKNIQDLRNLVDQIKAEEKTIAILAASTRGATIWQCAGLSGEQINYAVERNPEKVGKNFSAIGIPIVSEKRFREDKPDYALVGPWFFIDEIQEREMAYLKNGGCLIVPLPELKVVEWQN